MDLFDVFRIAAKRWFVFLPIAMVTMFFAYQAYTDVKPSYYTSVSVGLVSPSFKDVPVQSGPEEPIIQVSNGLSDSGGVSLLANLLSIGLNSPGVRAQVVAAGGSGGYSAEVFNLPNVGQLPIVVVSAQGPSAEQVKLTVQTAAGQADASLRGLQGQAGVPESRLVTAFPLSDVPEPTGGLPGRTRQTAGIAVAGLIGAIIAAVVFDAAWTRVRRPRVAASVAAESSGPFPDTTPADVVQEPSRSSDYQHDDTETRSIPRSGRMRPYEPSSRGRRDSR